MRKEMNKYQDGECVAIDALVVTGTPNKDDIIGIVLDSELVEMDQDLFEWLYTVVTYLGVEQYWPQEIKPVNCKNTDYNNNITHNSR